MTPFYLKSLRVRLLLLVLVAVIPALAAIAYTASEQRRLAVEEIQRNVLQLAEFSAHEEEQTLQGTRQILIALANFIGKDGHNSAACSGFCSDLLRQFRRYANLGGVNADGEVFCSAVALEKPTSAADLPWFKRALESNDFAVGDFHVGRITGKPVLVLSYPFRVAANESPKVVFAALDLHWLNRYIFEIESQLPDGFTITQIDENAVVMARQPDTKKYLGPQKSEDAIFSQVLAQKTGVLEAPGDGGKPYIYAFVPLHSSIRKRPVYMILGIPKSLAFADSNRIVLLNLILLGIAAVAAMLAAWFGSDLFIMRQVKAMANTSKRLAAGEMSARTGIDYDSGELGQLAQTFDEMAGALEQRQAERQRAEAELKRSQELFRNLSTHLQSVREEERTRIARKIHDDMGQALTALKIDLSWLNKRVAEEQEGVREKLKSMVSLINDTIETVHNVSEDLRPGILDDFGLAAAIEWQAEEFQKRTGIACEISLTSAEFDLSKETSTNLFRILQESLTNVIRHAEASRVQIRLEAIKGILQLEICDDGAGISQSAVTNPKSFGLIGMKERVRSLAGEIHIVGSPGQGTCLTVKIPISHGKDIQ